MKILKNFLSTDQVNQFKQYWIDYHDDIYVNWTDGDQLIDRRLQLKPTTPEWKLIENLVKQEFPTPANIWMALQEQSFPHNLHIDDYGTANGKSWHPEDLNVYTYVIALDTVPEFKTFVWKEHAHNNSLLQKHIIKWGNQKSSDQIKSNIATTEDLEHTYDENQQDYFVNYLDLDGIFTYHIGDAVLFSAKQYHCTSNWTKYPQHKMRRLLQIHVISK